MKKKLFAILMSAMMVAAFIPTMAFALPAEKTDWITLRSTTSKYEQEVETQYFNNAEMVKLGKYKAIDTEDMQKVVTKKQNGNKNIVIIDAMPATSWKAAHIPGAVCVEVTAGKYFSKDFKYNFTAEQKKGLRDAVGYKSKAKAKKSKLQIVVYCGFAGCDRSHYAAKYLKSLGYKNVSRYIGGGAAWEDAGKTLENEAGAAVAPHTRPAA